MSFAKVDAFVRTYDFDLTCRSLPAQRTGLSVKDYERSVTLSPIARWKNTPTVQLMHTLNELWYRLLFHRPASMEVDRAASLL
jgi:hypothetical protein